MRIIVREGPGGGPVASQSPVIKRTPSRPRSRSNPVLIYPAFEQRQASSKRFIQRHARLPHHPHQVEGIAREGSAVEACDLLGNILLETHRRKVRQRASVTVMSWQWYPGTHHWRQPWRRTDVQLGLQIAHVVETEIVLISDVSSLPVV